MMMRRRRRGRGRRRRRRRRRRRKRRRFNVGRELVLNNPPARHSGGEMVKKLRFNIERS